MHYKNGREAKEGDFVVRRDLYSKKVYAGAIHTLNSSSTSCNGQLAIAVPGGTNQWCTTISECLHAEDAIAAYEAANPEPAPAGVTSAG